MAAAGLPSPASSKAYVTGLMQATAAEIGALTERSDLMAVASQVGGRLPVLNPGLYFHNLYAMKILNTLSILHLFGATQADTSLRACRLIESMRGATRAALSATQPAIFALSAPLLRPLLLLQKAFHGHSVVVALLLKLAAEMVRERERLDSMTTSFLHNPLQIYHNTRVYVSVYLLSLLLPPVCVSLSLPPGRESHIFSQAC